MKTNLMISTCRPASISTRTVITNFFPAGTSISNKFLRMQITLVTAAQRRKIHVSKVMFILHNKTQMIYVAIEYPYRQTIAPVFAGMPRQPYINPSSAERRKPSPQKTVTDFAKIQKSYLKLMPVLLKSRMLCTAPTAKIIVVQSQKGPYLHIGGWYMSYSWSSGVKNPPDQNLMLVAIRLATSLLVTLKEPAREGQVQQLQHLSQYPGSVQGCLSLARKMDAREPPSPFYFSFSLKEYSACSAWSKHVLLGQSACQFWLCPPGGSSLPQNKLIQMISSSYRHKPVLSFLFENGVLWGAQVSQRISSSNGARPDQIIKYSNIFIQHQQWTETSCIPPSNVSASLTS